MQTQTKAIHGILMPDNEIWLFGNPFFPAIHVASFFLSLPTYLWLIIYRGIGAVVYKVPELENDLLLKISLRSVHEEDTTTISQVVPCSLNINILGRMYGMQLTLWPIIEFQAEIRRRWASECQFLHDRYCRISKVEGFDKKLKSRSGPPQIG